MCRSAVMYCSIKVYNHDVPNAPYGIVFTNKTRSDWNTTFWEKVDGKTKSIRRGESKI